MIAGHPALDLVNTVDWRWDPDRERWQPQRREDQLDGFESLVRWARQAGLVTAAEAGSLRTDARRAPRAASRALGRARRVREVLGRVFEAAGRGRQPEAADLGRLNAVVVAALRHRRLEARGARYAWSWTATGERSLEAVLSPIVLAAAELLISPQRTRIRACAAEDCGWLFIDTSRAGRRRWCSMQSCGNRAKARRFYARSKVSPEA